MEVKSIVEGFNKVANEIKDQNIEDNDKASGSSSKPDPIMEFLISLHDDMEKDNKSKTKEDCIYRCSYKKDRCTNQ